MTPESSPPAHAHRAQLEAVYVVSDPLALGPCAYLLYAMLKPEKILRRSYRWACWPSTSPLRSSASGRSASIWRIPEARPIWPVGTGAGAEGFIYRLYGIDLAAQMSWQR